jgi:hypothetical protein
VQEPGQRRFLPLQPQMSGIARHEDQIQLGVAEDLVGDLATVGAAGEADGWAKAHLGSLRRRPRTLYAPTPRRRSSPTTSEGRFCPPLSAQVTSTHRERKSSSAPRPGGAGRSVCQSKLPHGRVFLSLIDGGEAWSPRYTGHRRPDNVRVNYGTVSLGVWRSGSACRLQRQTAGHISSSGDQQEQPFMQVRAKYSLSSK